MTTEAFSGSSDALASSLGPSSSPSPDRGFSPVMPGSWEAIGRACLETFQRGSHRIPPITAPPPPEMDLKVHSVLRLGVPLDSPPSYTPFLTTHMFALWHMDKELEGSRWDGAPPVNALRFLSAYLTHLPLLSRLKAMIDTAVADQTGTDAVSIATTIMGKVCSLRPNESYLMIGGWGGTAAHAMLYKITRKPNNNFDIYIINTGDGLRYHEGISHDHKALGAPVEVIEDISPCLLCLGESVERSSPDFFLRLVNYRIPTSGSAIFLSAESIYEKGFGFLASKRRTVATRLTDFRTHQRGGSCSATVLKAWMAYELREEFDTWKSTCDFETILAFAKTQETIWFNSDPPLVDKLREAESLIQADELRHILRSAARDHLLSLSKRFSPERFDREMQRRYATLSELLHALDVVEEKVRIKRLREPNRVIWRVGAKPPNRAAILDGAVRFRVSITQERALSLASPQSLFPTTPNPVDFCASLEKLQAYLTTVARVPIGLSRAYRIAIEKYTEILPPMHITFWDQIPIPDLKRSAAFLFELLRNYALKTVDPRSLYAHEHNTALHLFCGLHKMLSRLDATEKNFLDGYGVYVACFRAQMHDRFFTFFHPQELVKRCELLNYLETLPCTKGLLCEFSTAYSELTPQGKYKALPDYLLLKTIQASKNHSDRGIITAKVEALHAESRCDTPLEITEAAYLLTEGLEEFSTGDSWPAAQLMKAAVWLQLFGGYSSPPPREEVTTRAVAPSREYRGFVSKWLIGHTYPSAKETLTYAYPKETIGFSGLHRVEHSALTTAEAFEREDTIEGAVTKEPLGRKVSDLPSEGQVMTLFAWRAAARIPFEKLLARTQTGSSFQTALLLFFLRENVTRLSQTDAMTLVELMLYKPICTRDDSWHIPLFKEIAQSQALVAQLDTFTRQSLSLLCDKQSASGFNVYPCLFFIRLIARLQEIYPDRVTFDPLPRLNQWLTMTTLPPEAMSLVHLHKIMAFYSRPNKRFTEAELLEILTSWMLFNQYPPSPKWKELNLEARATRFIYDLEPLFYRLFTENQESLQGFCRRVLVSCGLADTGSSTWRISSFPCVKVELGEGRWWEINLTHARVSCEAGFLYPGHHEDAKNHPDYKRLFGEEQFFLRRIGSSLTFTHPSHGEIRMHSRPDSQGTWHIYRFKNNQWFQYLPTQHLKTWRDSSKDTPALPLTLVADHTYWVHPVERSIIIEPINRADKKSYRLIDLQLEMWEEGVATATVEAPKDPFFAPFEKNPSCVYQLTSYHGRRGGRNSIHLDRYRGHDGVRLSFTQTPTSLSWDANPTFVLAEDQRRALLDYVPNYLLLSSVRGSLQRLLVPVQQVLALGKDKKSLTHVQHLDVEDQNRQDEYRHASEIVCSQREHYSYFEYDIVIKDTEVVITPLHLEGRLFLVYLFLVQRQYAHAKNLLREAFATECYSPQAFEILSWVLNASSKHADCSGSNAAIRLQAFLLLDRLNKRPDTTKKPSSQDWEAVVKEVIDIHKLYVDQIASIPRVLLLPPFEELAFVKSYCPQSRRLAKLQTGAYPPDETFPPALRPHRDLLVSPFSPKLTFNPFVLKWCTSELTEETKAAASRERIGYYLNLMSFEQTAPSHTIQESAKYFGYYYSLAKRCTTIEEAYVLAVKLDCFLERIKPDMRDLEGCYIALIHFALAFTEAPQLPTSTSPIDRWQWLLDACNRYNSASVPRFSSEPLGFIPAPPSTVFALSPPASRETVPRTPIEVLVERIHKRDTDHPLLVTASPKETIATKSLVTDFFTVTCPHESEELVTTLDVGIELPDQWKLFEKAIHAEQESFQRDLVAAARERREKKAYTFNSDRVDGLKDMLSERQKTYQEELLALEQTILGLARTPPSDQSTLALKAMLTAGEALLIPTIERLINLWLLGDLSAYTKCNPHLALSQLTLLDQLITAYLSRKTNSQQVERALVLVRQREVASFEDHANLDQLLAETLDAGGCFDITSADPHIRPLRVLEYRVNIRIRPQQVTLIANLLRTTESQRYNHAIAQMIMGGGKTSVLAAILLYIAAQRGNIAIFLAPLAQFHTLNHTLTTSLHRSFDMPVFSIAMTRRDMGELSNLRWFLETLKEAQTRKGAVLISPTVPQYLQLECLCLMSAEEAAQRDAGLAIDDIRVRKIQTMLEILHILQTESAIHLDEVDVLLNPLLEVNCPLDPPKHLENSTIDWMRIMFECMVDDTISVPGSSLSLAEEFNLRSPTRRFDPLRFRSTLMPCLAEALFNKHGATKLLLTTPDARTSFVRYVTGQMDADNPTREDQDFLTYLRDSSLPTAIPIRKTSAGLIALTKYLGTLVLESTLSRSVGMHYGRVPSGHVVPYDGVDAPTSNRFGNPFEAACYYFLTALATGDKEDRGIHPNQARMLMTEYRKTAELNVELDDVTGFDETPEGVECLELTGCPLSTVLTTLDAATTHINRSVSHILRVEAGTIAVSVDFYPHYFSSNSINLVGSLSTGKADGSSIRTMSGTPWDLYAYASRLKEEGLLLDVGAEGSIAHVVIAKARANPDTWIHEVRDISIPLILDSARAKDPTRNVRCIIDAAGLLKDKDSQRVAEETLLYFNDCAHVDAVLYFGRRSPEERPDCLMALKKTSGKPTLVVIGSTDPKELMARDIDINRCVTIYDQRHCEATDIPQPRNARALLFFNEHTNRRTLFQAIMRMRQFFKEQSVEFVVHEESRKLLVKNGTSPEAILSSALIPQAVAMSKNAVRTLRYDLAETPRDLMLKKLVELRNLISPTGQVDPRRVGDLLGFFRQFRPYLLTETTIDPCQFVELERTVQTIASLTDHAETLKAKWGSSFQSNSRDALSIVHKTAATLSSLDRNPYLPLEVATTSAPLGLGTQVQVEMQAEVQVQISTDLSQELEQELRRYLEIPQRGVKTEIHWTEGMCKARNFPRAHVRDTGITIETLGQSFTRCTFYAKEYHRVFQEAANLLVSDNWAFSMELRVPVFHPTQKPGQQILVIAKDDKTLDLMLLSVRETEFFKTRDDPNMWVIFSDGTEISSHSHRELTPAQKNIFDKTMLFVHLLNGDVKALTLSPGSLPFIMVEALRGRFLRLKVEGNPVQKNLFYLSPFAGSAQRRVFMCERRRIWQAQKTAELKDYSPEAIATLDVRRVPDLSGEQVRYLTTPEQIQSLTREQIPWVTAIQVPHVLEGMLDALDKPEQINAIQPERLKYLITTPHLLHLLTQPRIELIPVGDDDGGVIVPQLKREQIQFVPPQLSPYIGRALFDALTPAQILHICNIDEGERGHIYPSELVPYLTTQPQIEAIPAPLLKHLSPAQVLLCPVHRIPELPYSQIPHLRAKDQIQAVRRDQIRFLTSFQEQVCHLSDDQIREGAVSCEQINYMSIAQLRVVPDERLKEGLFPPARVNELEADRMAALDDNLLPHLTRPHLIQAIAGDRVRYLTAYAAQVPHFAAAQIPHVIPEQVPHIAPALVPDLGDHLLQYLTQAAQIQAVPADRAMHLTNFALQGPYLLAPQVAGAPDALIPHLAIPESIQAVPADRVHLLTGAHQFQHLSLDQAPYVTRPQAGGVPRAILHLIPPDALPDDRIHEIDPQHVPHLLDAQLSLLREPAQIQAVPADRAMHLTNFALQGPHLLAFQVATALDGLIPYLAIPESIQAVPEGRVPLLTGTHQFQHLSLDQAPYVTRLQAGGVPRAILHLIPPHAFPDDRIHEIDPQHVPHLLDAQLSLLREPAQIQAVPADRAMHLTNFALQGPYLLAPQVAAAPDGLIPYLGGAAIEAVEAARVRLLEGAYQLSSLTVDQLQHITVDQVFYVAPDHLTHVPEAIVTSVPENRVREFSPAHVPFLPNALLHHLDEEQFQQVTPQQVTYLSTLREDIRPNFVPCLVTAEQIAALPDPLLTHLNARTQLAFIPPERVPALPNHMLQFLTGDEHVERIQAITEARQQFVAQSERRRWGQLRAGLRAGVVPPPPAADPPRPPVVNQVPQAPPVVAPPLAPPQPPRYDAPAQLAQAAPNRGPPQPALIPPVIGIPQQRLLQNPLLPPQAFLESPAAGPQEKSSFQKIWEDWFAIQARNEKVVHTIRKIMAWTAVVFTAGILLFAIIAIASIHDALKRRRIQRPTPTRGPAPQIPRPTPVL